MNIILIKPEYQLSSITLKDKMRLFLVIIVFFSLSSLCYSQRQNDLQLMNLKGNVRSIKENMSLKNQKIIYNNITVFNDAGFIKEKHQLSTTYDSIIEKSEFIYDDKNILLSENKYSKSGKLIEEYKYKSNAFGQPIERARWNKGVIEYKETFEYNEKGNLIKETRYANAVPIWVTIYNYDDNNRLIEKKVESLGASKLLKTFYYTYDENNFIATSTNEKNQILKYKYLQINGNWVLQTCTKNDDLEWFSERTIKYATGKEDYSTKVDSTISKLVDENKKTITEVNNKPETTEIKKKPEPTNEKFENAEDTNENLSKNEKRAIEAAKQFNILIDTLKKRGVKCNPIDSFPGFHLTKNWIRNLSYVFCETVIAKTIYFDYFGKYLKGVGGGVFGWSGDFYIMPNNEEVAIGISKFHIFNLKTGKFLYSINTTKASAFETYTIWPPFIKSNDKWDFKEANTGYLNQPSFFRYNNEDYYIERASAGEKVKLWQAGKGLVWEQKCFEPSNVSKSLNVDDLAQTFAEVVSNVPLEKIISSRLSVNNVSSLLQSQLSKKCLNVISASPKGNIFAATFCGCTAINTNAYTEDIYVFAAQKGNPRLLSLEKPFMIIKEDKPSLIKFTCDNHYMLVKNSGSNNISVWELTTQTKKGIIENVNLANIAFHPTKPNLIVYSDAINIIVYDLNSLKIISGANFVPQYNNLKELIYFPTIKFSDDGKYLGVMSNIGDKSHTEGYSKITKFSLIDFMLISGSAYVEISKKIKELFFIDIDDNILMKACNDLELVKYVKNLEIKPKDEFETTDEFNNRIKSDLIKLISSIQNSFEKFYTIKDIPSSITLTNNQIAVRIDSIGKYDADNKVYKIYLLGTSAEVSIPPTEAKEFKEQWWKKALVILDKAYSKSEIVSEYTNIVVVNTSNDKRYKVELTPQTFHKLHDKYKKLTKNNITETSSDNTQNKGNTANSTNNIQSTDTKTNSVKTTQEKEGNKNKTKTQEELLEGAWVLMPSNNPYYCYSSKLIFSMDYNSLTGREERIVMCDKAFKPAVSTFSWRLSDDVLTFVFNGTKICNEPPKNPSPPYVVKVKIYEDSLRINDSKGSQLWRKFKSDFPKTTNNSFVVFNWEGNTVSTIKPSKWLDKEFLRKDNNANEGSVKLSKGAKFICNPHGYSSNGNSEWERTIDDWGVLIDCSGNLISSIWQDYNVYSCYIKFTDGETKMYNIYEKPNKSMTIFGFYEQWELK